MSTAHTPERLELADYEKADKRLTIYPGVAGVGDVLVDYDDVQHEWTLSMAREIVHRYNLYPELVQLLKAARVVRFGVPDAEQMYRFECAVDALKKV